MPWELTIRSEMAAPTSSSDEWPVLGEGEEVCRRISKNLPTVQWRREPSFIERNQHFPEDHPIRSFIANSTAEQKDWMSRSEFKGLYRGEGFTLEFFVRDGPISFFQMDVRGRGNPMPVLVRLCRGNKWAIKDVEGEVVDLDLPSLPGWEEFKQSRDQAVGEIEEEPQMEDADD